MSSPQSRHTQEQGEPKPNAWSEIASKPTQPKPRSPRPKKQTVPESRRVGTSHSRSPTKPIRGPNRHHNKPARASEDRSRGANANSASRERDGKQRGSYSFGRRGPAPSPREWRNAARERETMRKAIEKVQGKPQVRRNSGPAIKLPKLPKVDVPELQCVSQNKTSIKLKWNSVEPKPPKPPAPAKKQEPAEAVKDPPQDSKATPAPADTPIDNPPSKEPKEEPMDEAALKEHMQAVLKNSHKKQKLVGTLKPKQVNAFLKEKGFDSMEAYLRSTGELEPQETSSKQAQSTVEEVKPVKQPKEGDKPDSTDGAPNGSVESKNEVADEEPEPIPQYTCNYRVDMSREEEPGRKGAFRLVYEGPQLKCEVKKLKPGCSYHFRIQAFVFVSLPQTKRTADATDASAEKTIGTTIHSKLSPIVTFTSAPSVPKRPTNLRLKEATSDSLHVVWDVPHDSGAAITEYTVESNAMDLSSGLFTVVYCGGEPGFVLSKLQPATAYSFKVKATNRVGSSHHSETIELSTLSDVPGRPGAPRFNRKFCTMSSLQVTWKPPSITHGADIVGYELQISDNVKDEASWKTVFSGEEVLATVDGLTSNSTYFCRVRAMNAVGKGPFSDASHCKTSPACPDRPAAPHATVIKASEITMAWKAAKDNGSPIQLYRLQISQVSPPGPYVPVYEGPARSCVITDLQPHTSYQCQLQAKNALGPSQPSDPVEVKTHAAAPGVVAKVVTTHVKVTSFTCSWGEAEDHGSPVTSYNIAVDELSYDSVPAGYEPQQSATCRIIHHTAPTSTLHVDGLKPYTKYVVSVQAISQVGHGAWSEPAQVQTCLAKPPTPEPVELVETTKTSITVQWGGSAAKAELDGSLPTWVLEIRTVQEDEDINSVEKLYHVAYEGPDRKHRCTKLSLGHTYMFRLKRVNAVGHSKWSRPVELTTDSKVPTPPGNITLVERKGTSLTLKWGASTSLGCPIIKYLLDYKEKGAKNYKRAYSGASLQRTVKGLSAFKAYSIRVAAVNRVGQGPFQMSEFQTSGAAPPAPTAGITPSYPENNPHLVPTQLLVHWKARKADRDAEFELQQSVTPASSAHTQPFTTVYTGNKTSFKLKKSKIQPGATIRYRVVARNDYGESHASKEAVFKVPDEAHNPRARVNETKTNVAPVETGVTPTAADITSIIRKNKTRDMDMWSIVAMFLVGALAIFLGYLTLTTPLD